MKFIVTAGGQGTKLWPYSREDKPKQFQKVIGEKTLFQENIEALLKAYSPSDIYVSTKERYVKFVVDQTPEILLKNIIIEPNIKKNRGPAEGLAFLKMSMLHPDEPFMIIQSDCIRTPNKKFLEFIETAEELVKKDKKFITAGQKAMNPDMGCDYLKLGEKIEAKNGIQVFHVDEFVYRLGNYQKTKDLIQNFFVSTHTNHACWYPNLMLDAYKEYRTDWYEALMKMKDVIGSANEKEEIEKIYSKMEEGSTEEVTKHIFADGYVMLCPFKWIDMGTWSSVYDNFSKNGGIYKDGKVVSVDSERSLVKSEKDKVIALLGVSDLVVVDTEDALLICRKDRAGDIKQILGELKKEGEEEYL